MFTLALLKLYNSLLGNVIKGMCNNAARLQATEDFFNIAHPISATHFIQGKVALRVVDCSTNFAPLVVDLPCKVDVPLAEAQFNAKRSKLILIVPVSGGASGQSENPSVER